MMINFFRPNFDQEETDAVIRVMQSGHLTSGPEVEKLEQELAEYLNAPYVVAVDSCTNALFLALTYLRTKSEKGVMIGCPAITFASVAHEILHAGHGLKFVDEYWAGQKYQLQGTNIWDCAHEISRRMYTPGQIQCFSFYPNKLLGSTEGGAIATDDKDFAEWARLARSMGRRSRSYCDYDIEFAGWKMNMTDMQAAIARVQLKKLDEQLLDREVIRQTYNNAFAQLNDSNFLYVIEVKDRNHFMQQMGKENIMTSYHYKPLYEQPAYRQDASAFPYSEAIKSNIVTLPLYPNLTNEEVLKIIKCTKKYINASNQS